MTGVGGGRHRREPTGARSRLRGGPPVEGLLLAGGAGRRLGGVDKATVDVGGRSLLDRALDALAGAGAHPVVVVGPSRPGTGSENRGKDDGEVRAVFGPEPEPGGGPVPAVAAGLERLARLRASSPGPTTVLVLAVDLPLLDGSHLARLLDALDADPDADAAAALDHRGIPNPLVTAYRLTGLEARAARGRAGDAAALLLPDRVALVDLGRAATLNVNTPEDLAEARRLTGRRPWAPGGNRGTRPIV